MEFSSKLVEFKRTQEWQNFCSKIEDKVNFQQGFYQKSLNFYNPFKKCRFSFKGSTFSMLLSLIHVNNGKHQSNIVVLEFFKVCKFHNNFLCFL